MTPSGMTPHRLSVLQFKPLAPLANSASAHGGVRVCNLEPPRRLSAAEAVAQLNRFKAMFECIELLC
jgi:hypothetical protein